VKIRELLKKFRLRVSKQGEAKRLAESEERDWAVFVPSQQDDRPPH
jgi:hypothetical protein